MNLGSKIAPIVLIVSAFLLWFFCTASIGTYLWLHLWPLPQPQPQPHPTQCQQKPQDQPQPHAQPAPQLEHQDQPNISPSPTPRPRPSSSPSPIPKTSASSTPHPQNQPQDQPKPQPRICGGNFTAIGSKCYYIEKDNAQEWLSAIYQCSRMGGHLASIKSVQELDAISKELKSNSEYFVEKTFIPRRHGLGENRQIEPSLQKNTTGIWNQNYVCTVINSSGRIGTAMGYLNRLFVCEKDEEPAQEQKQTIIEDYTKIGEKYYYIVNSDPAQWNSAFHTCKNWGSHLATPRNELELINLSKILQPGIQYLIDLNDYLEEGQFMSVTTGSKNNYVSWAAGEPNMKFGVGNVVIEKTELGTYMRHVPHQYQYSYICETSI